MATATTTPQERRQRFMDSIRTTVPYDPSSTQSLGGQTFANISKLVTQDIHAESWASALYAIEAALHMQRLDGFQKAKLRMLQATVLTEQPHSKHRKAIRILENTIQDLNLEFVLNEKMPDRAISEILVSLQVAVLHLRLERLPKSASLRKKYRLALKIQPSIATVKQFGTDIFDIQTLDHFNTVSSWVDGVLRARDKSRNHRS